MLDLFGFDTASQQVYRALLSQPQFGVEELADALAMSELEVRAGLDALLDSGLVRGSSQYPGRLRAVDPEVGLEVLLRQQEEEIARKQQELLARRTAVAVAVAELRPSEPGDSTRRLLGIDAVRTEIEILSRQVVSETHTVTAGPALPADMLEAARPLDRALLSRGVTMHVLYQDSVRNDRSTFAYACWMNDLGGHVRTAPLLPPPMLLYDRTVAIVLIDPADRGRGALCTREPGIVAYLLTLFDQAWSSAVPLGTVREEEAHGLSVTERELLKLLAGGMTDESAAKRLGVSLSTVRRLMASLMERLEASSRFEAGLRAAQRGWV